MSSCSVAPDTRDVDHDQVFVAAKQKKGLEHRGPLVVQNISLEPNGRWEGGRSSAAGFLRDRFYESRNADECLHDGRIEVGARSRDDDFDRLVVG